MSKFDEVMEQKDSASQYMVDQITYVVENCGLRSPGDPGELKACEYLADELKNNCGCDNVKIDSFKLNPNAFYGWIYVSITCGLLNLLLYFFLPLAGAILMAIGFVVMILEFILYKKAIDPLFPEKTSHNLTATKKPTGEIKQRVFFQGHMDAAWNWPVNEKLGGRAYVGHIIIAVVGVFYMFVLAIVRCCMMDLTPGVFTPAMNPGLFYAGIADIVFLPFIFGMYFMWNENKVVPGANDDMSGCLMAVGILHQLQESGCDLEHTEVGVILSGSEEAGLRGTKAWCQEHKDDFKDVPTYIFSFDTINDLTALMANYKDLNSTVTTDKELNDKFCDSCDELGIKIKKGAIPFFGGSTDAAGFAQGGFRCAGITAMSQSPIPSFYHTVKDKPELLNKECMATVFTAAVNCLKHLDEEVNK